MNDETFKQVIIQIYQKVVDMEANVKYLLTFCCVLVVWSLVGSVPLLHTIVVSGLVILTFWNGIMGEAIQKL